MLMFGNTVCVWLAWSVWNFDSICASFKRSVCSVCIQIASWMYVLCVDRNKHFPPYYVLSFPISMEEFPYLSVIMSLQRKSQWAHIRQISTSLTVQASSSPSVLPLLSSFNHNLQPLLLLLRHCSLCLFVVMIRRAGRWWVYLGPARLVMSNVSDMLEQRQRLPFIVF